MDYGPFGFIEKYNPNWNMWTGGGEHYSFMNQPKATQHNYASLANSMKPLLTERQDLASIDHLVESFSDLCEEVVREMWRKKLGLMSGWTAGTGRIFMTVERLMRDTVDYTIFWRQLAQMPRLLGSDWRNLSRQELLAPLLSAFYDPSFVDSVEKSRPWYEWAVQYLEQLETEQTDPALTEAGMKQVSPKFIPREWMLVEAYTAAQKEDYKPIHELYAIFQTPYDDLPGHDRFYRIASSDVLSSPGIAYMTCSS